MKATEFRVPCDYFRWPETMRLGDLLGPSGPLRPLQQWAWVETYRKYFERHPEQRTADLIESVLDWKGKPGELLEALKQAGFVGKTGQIFTPEQVRGGK
jgi:hypothetical protein